MQTDGNGTYQIRGRCTAMVGLVIQRTWREARRMAGEKGKPMKKKSMTLTLPRKCHGNQAFPCRMHLPPPRRHASAPKPGVFPRCFADVNS